MSVKIGHASIDERGRASGGTAGDQTGREVCIREWYNKSWNKVIRATDPKVAEKIAQTMEAACNNDNIGYDQFQRTTLFTEAKKVNWNLGKITVKCETDCSALIAVCVNAAGVSVSKDIYTGNEAAALKATGEFQVLTLPKYLNSDKYLMRGDILLNESHHTAVVLSNGTEVITSTDNPKKSIREVANEVIAGMWGNGDDRTKALIDAGYSVKDVQEEVNKILGVKKQKTSKEIKKGDKIKIKSGAVDANSGKKFADFVYKNTYTVLSVSNGYVVFGKGKTATGKTRLINCTLK